MKTTLMLILLLGSQLAFGEECRLRNPVRLPEDPFKADAPAGFKGVLLNKVPDSLWRYSEIVNGQGQLKLFEIRQSPSGSWNESSYVRTGFLGAYYTSDFPDGRNDLGYGFANSYMGPTKLSGQSQTSDGVTTYSTRDDMADWIHHLVKIRVKDGYVLSIEFEMPKTKDDQYVRPVEYETICVLDMHG